MDGAGHLASDEQRQPPLWSLPGFSNNIVCAQSVTTPPFSTPVASPDWAAQTADQLHQLPQPLGRSPTHKQWECNLSIWPKETPKRHHLPALTAPHTAENCLRLETENASLTRLLAAKDQALQSAQRTTRELAAWALKERTRLMAEALHQRLLREDYEAVLHQRDKQVVHLLALRQDRNPVSTGSVKRISGRKEQLEPPVIDRYGAVVEAPRGHVLEESDQSFHGHLSTVESQMLEEGDIAGVEEGAYSPPDFARPLSITAQVDELIAEEASRLGG